MSTKVKEKVGNACVKSDAKEGVADDEIVRIEISCTSRSSLHTALASSADGESYSEFDRRVTKKLEEARDGR